MGIIYDKIKVLLKYEYKPSKLEVLLLTGAPYNAYIPQLTASLLIGQM